MPQITAPTSTAPPTPQGQQPTVGAHMVALDIDGTLTAERRTDVPKPNADAVADARRAGHHIVLASGRSLAGVLPIAEALGLDYGWATASNGAVTARLDPALPDGHIVEDGDMLLVDVADVTMVALQLRLPDLAIAVEHVGVGYYTNRPFPPGLLRGTATEVPMAMLETFDSPRVVLRARGVHALMEPLRAVGGLTVTESTEPDWIDVTPGNVSKATALETVRQRLGVGAANTLAIGDGINDIEALTWAARGVAMGHAPLQVREAANEITGTLGQHGVAAVLRTLPTVTTTR